MKLTLTPSEITAMVVACICRETQTRGWSLLRLSEESGVPYDTVKKLVTYRIDNPHLSNIVKIACALEMDFNTLIDLPQDSKSDSSGDNTTTREERLSAYLLRLEQSLAVCKPYRSREYIPLLHPLGIRQSDAYAADSFSVTMLAIDEYRRRFGSKLTCGLSIPNDNFHPVYYKDDILLIGTDRAPLSGETGIFIKDSCIYLRKYLNGSCITLAPVNNLGSSICLDSFDGWYIFGYVLTVYR